MSANSTNRPDKLGLIINRSGNETLSPLIKHVDELLILQDQLNNLLESPLVEHCRVCNYSDDTLSLQTDSPAWAARLRYKIPEILVYFRDNCLFTSLKTIRIRVRPDDSTAQTNTGRKIHLSVATATLLKQIADNIDDSELRKSLYQLAEHQND